MGLSDKSVIFLGVCGLIGIMVVGFMFSNAIINTNHPTGGGGTYTPPSGGGTFSPIAGTCSGSGQIINNEWYAKVVEGSPRTGDTAFIYAVPQSYKSNLYAFDYINSDVYRSVTVASQTGTSCLTRDQFNDIVNSGKIPVLYVKPSGYGAQVIDLTLAQYHECRSTYTNFPVVVTANISPESTFKIVEADIDFATIDANTSYRAYLTVIGSMMPEGNKYPVFNFEDKSSANEVDSLKVIYAGTTINAEYKIGDTDNFYIPFKSGIQNGRVEIIVVDETGAMKTSDVNISLTTHGKPVSADVNIPLGVVGSTIDTKATGTVA